MTNLYIHIPFCRKACHYCNFHFSTNFSGIENFLRALDIEIESLREMEQGKSLRTIYFGGGTPSVLSPEQLASITEKLSTIFDLSGLLEVTLEMNPEDATPEYINELKKKTEVNRISLGIQSLDTQKLEWMNRNHDSDSALLAIEKLQNAGLENISADLIFGYAELSMDFWQQSLEHIIDLGIPHISHYALSVEPKTVFAHRVSKGAQVQDEDAAAQQMLVLYEILDRNGFQNYELSNSAKPGFKAVHNSGYWKGQEYLGLGPSAHGYDGGRIRYQNISNNALYAKLLEAGEPIRNYETLNDEDLWQEYLMTKLRTYEGINFEELNQSFGENASEKLCRKFGNIPKEKYQMTSTDVRLTYQGWIWSDAIFVDLFD